MEKSHYQWKLEKRREAYEEQVSGRLSIDDYRMRLRLIEETTPEDNEKED